jgi:hypothetical protein
MTKDVSEAVRPSDSTMIEIASADTLAISKAEIDLQIATAKSYPRSLAQFQRSAMEMVTYSREAAEKMFYKLPRGGKIIEGPSVRLAEIIGQNWRNCRIGARVLGNDDKTVTSQGVFHDLETNVAISFEIKRRITRKDGTRYDDDMIGVTGAAAAGIAFRNAVLKGIPKIFWQPLYEKALETARGDDKDIAPRRKAAIAEFEKMGVPETALLKTLGVTGISKIGPDELVTLRGMYNAIREGTTTAAEAFELGPKPLEPTREIGEDPAVKKPEGVKKSASKSPKKEAPPADSGVPKAQIPKGSIAPTPAEDPLITTAEQTQIYNKGVANGWKVPDEVRSMLTKRFKVDSVKAVRRSQLADIFKVLESGT